MPLRVEGFCKVMTPLMQIAWGLDLHRKPSLSSPFIGECGAKVGLTKKIRSHSGPGLLISATEWVVQTTVNPWTRLATIICPFPPSCTDAMVAATAGTDP